MGTYYNEVMSEFWMTVIEKLNSEEDRRLVLADVLERLCRYFNFGCGFIYVADHQELFHLYESYRATEHYDYLTEPVSFKDGLKEELYRALYHGKNVLFDMETRKTELEQGLGKLFQAKSLILVPVRGKGGKLTAFVGMLDRRGRNRNENQNLKFAAFILSVIANYVSTVLFRKRNEGAMKTLRSVLDNTGVNVYVTDFVTNEVMYVNRTMAEAYGGEAALLGRPCWEAFMGETGGPCKFCPKPMIVDRNNNPTEPYIWNLHQPGDNTWRRMISVAFYWIDGRLACVNSYIDITETIKNQDMIRHYAEYDTLTGLMNRHKLLLDCDDGLEVLKGRGGEGYLIFCDLDRFKQVNDQYGHTVGDELLAAVGQYFRECEQTRECTYRYAGDEFVILCLNESREAVETLRGQIEKDFQVPWKLSIGELVCRASLGVTGYPGDALTTSDLLHSADMAMYEYKRKTYQ